MPRLDDYAKHIVELSMDARFPDVWKYFERMMEELQEEINEVSTPTEKRELLVGIRAWIDREVIQLPQRAHRTLDKTGTP